MSVIGEARWVQSSPPGITASGALHDKDRKAAFPPG